VILRNLTAHPVVIIIGQAEFVLPAEFPTPRLLEEHTQIGTGRIDGHEVPLFELMPGTVVDLPDQNPGVGLVVARAVAVACPGRTDLFVPFQVVRDNVGRVTACRALARILPAGP